MISCSERTKQKEAHKSEVGVHAGLFPFLFIFSWYDCRMFFFFFFIKSSVFQLKEKKKHYLWWFYYLFVYLSVLSLSFPLRNTLSMCSYSVACSFSSSSSFILFNPVLFLDQKSVCCEDWNWGVMLWFGLWLYNCSKANRHNTRITCTSQH